MSLRLRLVLGLAAMLVVGLAVSGVLTYSFYAPSQYQGLDGQLRSSEPLVSAQLLRQVGLAPQATNAGTPGGPPGGGGGGGGGGGSGPGSGGPGGRPTVVVPLGTYGELLTQGGTLRTQIQYGTTTSYRPALPSPLPRPGSQPTLVTTGSTAGGASWRVLIDVAPPAAAGDLVVIAFPTASVQSALDQLVVVELGVALGLLVVLMAVAWLMLRSGLRPLEEMASTARSITGGDLSQRVGPERGAREVVALGTALDTMLGDLEVAFAERDATEQRLRQFLADVSHELRTPLTSIQGFAELFRMGVSSEHVDEATIVRRIEDEAARMRRLVEDLLLLARLDQAPAVARVPVDLAVLAADACSDAVATDPAREVTLAAPAPVVVDGDEGHLRQAIGNLVGNAIGHTPPGTPIEVAARSDAGDAVVEVRDHGAGLDEEALAHVFDRFWQADRARAGTGAGLGLAIVAAIAAEHGGRVSAANADGAGAVFRVTLPLAGAPLPTDSSEALRVP